jgi:hypothetical protein
MMSAPLAPQTVRVIARVATESGRRVRFAMRGRSMLPLLREPMILDVAPLAGRPSVGDVIVFAWGDVQAAHRVIGYDEGRYVASGDAQPEVREHVGPSAVLGRVESVWENDSPSARRVDTGLHRLRGQWFARAHPMRRQAARARALARSAVRRLLRLTRRGTSNASPDRPIVP